MCVKLLLCEYTIKRPNSITRQKWVVWQSCQEKSELRLGLAANMRMETLYFDKICITNATFKKEKHEIMSRSL